MEIPIINRKEQQLREVYYKPNHLWKDSRAIGKLHKITGIPCKTIKSWLA